YEPETQRKLRLADGEVQRHLELALAGIGIAQDENGQAVHGKTPDHAKSIQVGEEGHVAGADDDGEDVEADDDVDDAIAGAEARMRLTEPVAQDAIFGNPVEHSVRAHNRGVDGTGENDGANHHHEGVEYQPQQKRPLEAHRESADEVFKKALANAARKDHHREERNQRGEDHAVDEDHQPGLFQVDEFRAFDFAIDLSQGLFAAHGQHRVTQGDKDGHDAEHLGQ